MPVEVSLYSDSLANSSIHNVSKFVRQCYRESFSNISAISTLPTYFIFRDKANVYDNADTASIDTLTLETIVLQTRAKEISQLEALSKKVYYLHTDLLYYRKANSELGASCYEAWKVLMKKVGGTANGWRDLGYALGVSQDDLDVSIYLPIMFAYFVITFYITNLMIQL